MTSDKHLGFIDQLRGVAILLVALGHIFGYAESRYPAPFELLYTTPEPGEIAGFLFTSIFCNGFTGVMLFFVISGFCIRWSASPCGVLFVQEFLSAQDLPYLSGLSGVARHLRGNYFSHGMGHRNPRASAPQSVNAIIRFDQSAVLEHRPGVADLPDLSGDPVGFQKVTARDRVVPHRNDRNRFRGFRHAHRPERLSLRIPDRDRPTPDMAAVSLDARFLSGGKASLRKNRKTQGMVAAGHGRHRHSDRGLPEDSRAAGGAVVAGRVSMAAILLRASGTIRFAVVQTLGVHRADQLFDLSGS